MLINAFTCPTLKVLKIYINYSPKLLNKLLCRLKSLKNLEYICFNISENCLSFQNSIKTLVELIQNKNTLVSKIKVYNYTWDLDNLIRKNDLIFTDCSLNPADLMLFAELCEKGFAKNINFVNMSKNKEIVDDKFSKNMARVIKALKCKEVLIKDSGCKKKHIKEIKSLVGENIANKIDFRIF